ncbi:MAG: hypothetical protein GX678_07050 [Actinomycetales bacterium]|nr:hypothetical protein [Actinomycetales bacterium]
MLERAKSKLPDPWGLTPRGLAIVWLEASIEFAADGIYLTRSACAQKFSYSETLGIEISLPRARPWLYRVLAVLFYWVPTHVQTSASVELTVSSISEKESTRFIPSKPYTRREIDSCESLMYLLSELDALSLLADVEVGQELICEVYGASVGWFPDLTWSRTRKIVKKHLHLRNT